MEFEMGSRALAEKSRAPKVGHHFGRSAARHRPDRPAVGVCRCLQRTAPCTIARVRGVFGARGPWISARSVATSPQQTCHDHLPSISPHRASAAAIWSEFYFSDQCPRPTFGPDGRGRRSARGNGRQVIVAGLLRARRDTSSGDPWTTGARHPSRSRDGARCGALKAAARRPRPGGRGGAEPPTCQNGGLLLVPYFSRGGLHLVGNKTFELHFSPPRPALNVA